MNDHLATMAICFWLALIVGALWQIRDEIHAGHGACERAPAAGMVQG